MKKLILIASVFIFLSCTPNPTDKQIAFAEKLLEAPGVLKTEWKTNLSLDVTVDINKLGLNPKYQAQLLADQIGASGLEYTDKSICVLIYYGYKNKLANSCFSK